MRELSIHIDVRPLESDGQEAYHFMADAFDFDPVPEDSDAGRCFVCDKDIVCELPEADTVKHFVRGVRGVVEFKDARQNSFRVGDADIPAMVFLVPHLNTATLQIRCRMLQSPLL